MEIRSITKNLAVLISLSGISRLLRIVSLRNCYELKNTTQLVWVRLDNKSKYVLFRSIMIENRSHSHLWPGVPLALGSAVLFGSTPPIAKLFLSTIDPFILAGLLYLGAGIGLTVYQVVTQSASKEQEAPLSFNDMPWLMLAIASGGVIGPILLMFGLTMTSASNSSLLLNLEGLLTMAIAWLAYKENVDRRLLLGAIAILVGAALLSWQGQGISFDAGALFIAGACLAWGLDNNFTRKISATDPVRIAMLKGLIAGAVNLGIGLITGGTLPELPALVSSAILGFFGIGVSLVMFILALRHLEPVGHSYSRGFRNGSLQFIDKRRDALPDVALVAEHDEIDVAFKNRRIRYFKKVAALMIRLGQMLWQISGAAIAQDMINSPHR